MTFFTNFLSIGVIFLANFVPQGFPCQTDVRFTIGCCHSIFSLVCAIDLPDPACNIFHRNCVICQVEINKDKNKQCFLSATRCSCYYCCDKKYAAHCPQGCEYCINDGFYEEGGCPENHTPMARLASSNYSSEIGLTENSPFVYSLKKVETARKHFDTVDADKSGTISMKEAIAYLVETKNGTSADHLAKNSEWFGKMDSNGNSQIEPVEFDRSLI
ncbi:hypothetical protein niasHS_004767 [Heterodera schachtii]|uniref:EF-hand domain-containing protein n=1 Tax=Heterodera schachtii TaxID=97005 RepID=A0ABD2JVY7_HETSC